MIRSIRQEWNRLPSLLRIGLLVFLTGCGLDLFYHGMPAAWVPSVHSLIGAGGERGHLVIMTGMALIVLGLIVEGSAHGGRKETEVRSENLR